ncbi:unnamed protein product [Spodoptera littoralis]|uniref:Inosine/uridine-preferring nucleoside hydrolase domain-containing protein n=1 Tax=Spodoptera littoralis TaxID=7109 RepID=A0A9P0N5I8_SPOLI|nr:unnamed protein product [Spodoptera littoralis]CAH1643203.1 unnamed protein product [Spodoptera littoralis]
MLAAKKLIVYIGIPLVALLVVVGIALGFIFYYKDPEASPVSSRKKLVIDHDGGADDAFAVTLSLLNEKYFDGPELVALTTTFGNVNLTQAIINSHRFLALCDREDIPIYSGAHKAFVSDMVSDNFYGMDGLGDTGYEAPSTIEIEKNPAAVALIELSELYEGELIVVAIGPVTNIALAARLDPDFIGRLSQLYVGAGHVHSETHSEPEFNAAMDPEAYYIMADSAAADKDWRENVLGKIETPIMEALNMFERISFSKESSWTQLDPAVASIALHNEIVDEFKYSNNSIILQGESRGINTNDFSSSELNTRLIPIYSGAHKSFVSHMVSDHFYGMDGLGDNGYEAPSTIKIEKNPAAVALIELSKKYEGELIVVAIGPLTNIALAVRLDPDFIGETHSEPEFNAAMDPEAYYIMADSATVKKVTVLPFSQVYSTLNVSKEWRKNVLGKIDTPIMEALNMFERVSFSKESSWIELDPAMAAIALHNKIVDEFKYSNNSIILQGESRGINTNDFSSSEPNTRLVYKANIEYYQKFLLDVYSAELNP